MAKSAQIARLQRRLEAIPQAVREDLQPVLIAAGEELAATMRNLAPVDEGNLKASINVTPPGQMTLPYSQPGGSRLAGENEVLVAAGDQNTRYPHLVEYGTAHAPAQPFFWPAFRLGRKKLASKIKRAIGKAVRDEWARP